MSGVILPKRDLNEVEQARFRRYIVDHYFIFTTKVAESRGMEIDSVLDVAQGRVFSGIGALNAGLIDSIGGLGHAIKVAKELAGIPDNQGVAFEQLPRPTFLDRLIASLSRMLVRSRAVVNLAGSPTVETALFMTELLPATVVEDVRFRIANNGRVMPVLPMDSWR